MKLNDYCEKLEAYALGALEASSKKGKVSKLEVSWSSASFLCRVHDLGWTATTPAGFQVRDWVDTLRVELEPKKELAALLKRHPSSAGFFSSNGQHALHGAHETPPGEYGLWLRAIIDEAIAATGKKLARSPAFKKVALSIEGHDGDGPFASGHYLGRIPEARRESGTAPGADFLRAFFRLFFEEEKSIAAWLKRAGAIPVVKADSGWTECFLMKILPGKRAEQRGLTIKGPLVRELTRGGSRETLNEWKLRTPAAAREKADAVLAERLAEGFVGSADELVAEVLAFRATEHVLGVSATLSFEVAGEKLDATAPFARWLQSSKGAEARLARALVPNHNALEYAAKDAWLALTELRKRQFPSDEAPAGRIAEPIELSAANAKALEQLVEEVRSLHRPGAAQGPIAWCRRESLRAAGPSTLPSHLIWRIAKRRR